jgi:hypothetical protein
VVVKFEVVLATYGFVNFVDTLSWVGTHHLLPISYEAMER